jgi:hypothetical protein
LKSPTPVRPIADAFGIDAALSVLLPDMDDVPSDEVIASLFEISGKVSVH